MTPASLRGPDPAPEPEPVREPAKPEQVQRARETASKAGVMAFSDALADLRENTALAAVTSSAPLTAGAKRVLARFQ